MGEKYVLINLYDDDLFKVVSKDRFVSSELCKDSMVESFDDMINLLSHEKEMVKNCIDVACAKYNTIIGAPDEIEQVLIQIFREINNLLKLTSNITLINLCKKYTELCLSDVPPNKK